MSTLKYRILKNRSFCCNNKTY